MQQFRNDYSLTFPPLSIARYSFIQLSRLRRREVKENAQTSKRYQRGFEPGFSRLRVRHSTTEPPRSTKNYTPKNEVSQCYSRSRKCPKHFTYQKQQLSVARVWPSWCNHSLATASHASNESLDGCHLNSVPIFSEGISQFHESSCLDWTSQNRQL